MANFEIIVNYVSGGGNGAPALKAVTNVLSENGHNYTVHQTQYKKHATELASELTSGEDEVNLIVIGGDGTIGEVISGIVNFEKVTLGIVASGTGNDFIRAAKLP
ncbi:MAG: diacylglycerol kinase family lipid kinase, partial [Christensenellaceae bacterium]|nr:diacylglycerol kinase family lipid kinase [Christensenellaceae bacterium]